MGLLDIFNKKKDNNQNKDVRTQTHTNYAIEFPNSDMQLEFYDIKMYNQVDYGKELSNLFTARIQQVDENLTMMLDQGDFICFEIPENMTIEKMFKARLLEGMLQIGRFNGLDKGRYNHVGRIKQKEDGTFTIQEPTDSVMNYVRTNLDRQILENDRIADEKMQKSIIENERHQNEFKMKIEKQASQHKELVEKERNRKKK